MKFLAAIRTLGCSPFIVNLLHWIFISRLRTFIFNLWIWLLLLHNFLFFGFGILYSLNHESMILSLGIFKSTHMNQFIFPFVIESKKAHKEGIFQLETTSLVAWNVDTKSEYSGPNLERMERNNCSYFFSIPQCLIIRTSDLNLVKKPSMELKLIVLNENNSFSNWCTLISSCNPKRYLSLLHT